MIDKKKEMKERLTRFIKNQREFIATIPNVKEGIETASLDLAQMVAMIPEEDMPLFREIITELEQERKRSELNERKN